MKSLLTIEFSKQAEQELEAQISYYENLVEGLGSKFAQELETHLRTISLVPHSQVRYDLIHCVPLSRFPFMIHYSVIEDRQVIRVQAVIHTSLNPNNNWGKDDWQVTEEENLYLQNLDTVELVYSGH